MSRYPLFILVIYLPNVVSQLQVSSTNPKSKFTVFPTSFSPSYDRSTDALRSGSNSSSTYSDESYSRNSSKPPRESFNMSPEHKSGSSGRSDNRQFGGNEFQRESVPKVVPNFMYKLMRGKFSAHSYCFFLHALMLTI